MSLVATGQVNGTSGNAAARVDRLITTVVRRGQGNGTFRGDVPAVWLVDLWFAALQSALVHAPPPGTDTVALVTSLVTGAAAAPAASTALGKPYPGHRTGRVSRAAPRPADGDGEN